MFRHSGCGGYDAETRLFCGILQFSQCILICPVAVNADENCLCTVPSDGGETLCRRTRYAAAVRRDCDHCDIIFFERNTGKIDAEVCQIHRLNLCSYFLPPAYPPLFSSLRWD